MPAIRILTLGTAAVVPGNLSQQPKRLALLAYLSVARPRGPHRRDDLVALLWPEMSQDRARSALRQALHGLRKTLGEDVIRSYGAELLELNATLISCDLWELERALDAGDANLAAQLYHRELLRGLFVSDAIEFDTWLETERLRLAERVREAYWRAASCCGRTDRVTWVTRAIALAPLDEERVRAGIALLGADGNLPAALEVFEQLKQALKRELELQPSAETQALIVGLRREHLSERPAVTLFESNSELVPPLAESVPIVVSSPPPMSPALLSPPLLPPPLLSAPWSESPTLAPKLHSPTTRQRPSVWRKRSILAVAAMTATIATIASAAALSSKFGARDPRIIAVVSEFGSTDDAASRTRTFAATAAVRRAIAQSNLFTLLDSTNSSSRAGTIVRVGVEQQAAGYRIASSIVDRAGGVVRDGIRGAVALSPDDAWRTGADRVTSVLAAALYPGWARALSQPPSMTAYRAFVAGMDQIVHEQHASAIALFLEAYRADSSFTAAGLLGGAELFQAGKYVEADSLARAISLRRGSLAPVDRALLDWLQYSLSGNRAAAFAAMQEVTRRAPSAELAWLQLATEAAENGNAAQALKLFDEMKESATFGEVWPAYWANRAEVLHLLGNHQRELREVQSIHRAHPEMTVLDNYELRARAALLDTAPMWQRLQVLSETGNRDVPTVLRQVAMELRAHGDAPGALRALAMARRWYATQHLDTATVAYKVGVARVAYLQDDRPTALALYDQIAQRPTTCIECLGARGVLAARGNNRAEALRVDSVLSRSARPYLFGWHTLWRARIAATLGDVERARILYLAAREEGQEIDVLTHADADLRSVMASLR